MKINKILMGLGAVAALSLGACSNDEPANTGNTDDPAFGDQYITVSVMMPTSNGSRADATPPYGDGEDQIPGNNDFNKYDQGTAEESAVSNAVFIFFDTNKNVVDIQKFTDVEWKQNDNLSNNPYVTKYGEKDIRLKAGLDYSWVAVLLNSSSEVGVLRARIKDLASLEAYAADYVKQITSTGANQLMTNSVYFNTENRTIKPEENQKVILVQIKEENKSSKDNKEPDPVEVYVERVVARVDVEMTLGLGDDNTVNNFSISNSDVSNKLILFDNVTFTQREVEIVPVLNGVMLDVLTPSCKLIKPLEVGAIGYVQGATNYNAFQWNDPLNKRSYWATTQDFDKNTGGMIYKSWDDMAKNGLGEIHQYVHPNTQQFEPLANAVNEDRSMNTKVVVAATLKYKDGNELKDLDLVQYGAEYMFASNFISQAASVANTAVRGIDWATASMQGNDEEAISFSPAEAYVLQVAVNNSFLGYERISENTYQWIGLTPDMFVLTKKKLDSDDAEDNDYESRVASNNLFWTINWNDAKEKLADYNDQDKAKDQEIKALLADDNALAALEEKIAPFIDNAITAAVDNLNEPRILHWNGGKTYYYYVIRHQGFYGLVGDRADNYVYGLVRNHIYDVKLQTLYGLGTPVIDSSDPIDPERPNDEEPTYIQAKINILPWRVVKNNATLH